MTWEFFEAMFFAATAVYMAYYLLKYGAWEVMWWRDFLGKQLRQKNDTRRISVSDLYPESERISDNVMK